jgi:alpha-1,2-mannosyltransferase
MPAILDAIRTGAWLTRSRMRLWPCAILLVSAAAVLFLLATAHGLNDYHGRPIGTDFSNVYAAGTYVLDGQTNAPFDSPRQYAREQQIFGAATPFYGWHYPPFFLFVAAALATMPHLLALAVWQGATLALYLLAVRAVLRYGGPPAAPRAGPPHGRLASDPLWLVIALAYPAVFVNLGHGHN